MADLSRRLAKLEQRLAGQADECCAECAGQSRLSDAGQEPPRCCNCGKPLEAVGVAEVIIYPDAHAPPEAADDGRVRFYIPDNGRDH